MPRMTKTEIMQGITCKTSKVVTNNTVEYVTKSGTVVIRHFRTDIIRIDVDGVMTFNTKGHKSKTTKSRINELQSVLNLNQESRVWYAIPSGVNYWGMTKTERLSQCVIFQDNMKYYPLKKLIPPKTKSIKFGNGWMTGAGTVPDPKLIKKIKQYAQDFVNQLPVEPPGAGDCFICQILPKDSVCHDHLLSHIEEGYYVPRLLLNAMNEAGVGSSYIAAAFGKPSIVRLNDVWFKQQYKKWLYNYMYRRLVDNQQSERLQMGS